MKKITAVLVALMLMSFAFAQASEVIASGGSSNVRTGPARDYDSIGTLKSGKTAEFLGDVEEDERGVEWYAIRYNGQYGWVSSKYCDIIAGDYDEEDVDDDDDYDDDEDYDEDDEYDAFIKTTAEVNVRSGPGLDYSKITALKKGVIVEFAGVVSEDERGIDWYKVYTSSGTGWVSSKYADLTADDYQYISYSDDDDDDVDEEDEEEYVEDTDDEDEEDAEVWMPIIGHSSGTEYAMGLEDLNTSFSYDYGKSGFVYQATDNIEDEDSLDYTDVPAGNIGSVIADLDHDGADELLVAGQSDDRLLTLAVYEATSTGSVLKDCCVLAIDTVPMCSEKDSNGLRMDVFLYNNNSIGISYYDLLGLRGDGTTVTFVSAVYDGTQITAAYADSVSGSDWSDMEDCELINDLNACGIDTTIDAIMSGSAIADMVSDKVAVGGMKSQNLLTYDQLAKGKAVADVTVNEQETAQPDFTFSFQ